MYPLHPWRMKKKKKKKKSGKLWKKLLRVSLLWRPIFGSFWRLTKSSMSIHIAFYGNKPSGHFSRIRVPGLFDRGKKKESTLNIYRKKTPPFHSYTHIHYFFCRNHDYLASSLCTLASQLLLSLSCTYFSISDFYYFFPMCSRRECFFPPFFLFFFILRFCTFFS